jgi:hypothetical protein
MVSFGSEFRSANQGKKSNYMRQMRSSDQRGVYKTYTTRQSKQADVHII